MGNGITETKQHHHHISSFSVYGFVFIVDSTVVFVLIVRQVNSLCFTKKKTTNKSTQNERRKKENEKKNHLQILLLLRYVYMRIVKCYSTSQHIYYNMEINGLDHQHHNIAFVQFFFFLFFSRIRALFPFTLKHNLQCDSFLFLFFFLFLSHYKCKIVSVRATEPHTYL